MASLAGDQAAGRKSAISVGGRLTLPCRSATRIVLDAPAAVSPL